MSTARTGTVGLTQVAIGGAPLGAVGAAEVGAAAGPAGMLALLLAALALGVRAVVRNRPVSTRRAAERAARRSERQAQRRRTSAARSAGVGSSRRTAGHSAAKPRKAAKGTAAGSSGPSSASRPGRKSAAARSAAGRALGRVAGAKRRKAATSAQGAGARRGSRPAGRGSTRARGLLNKGEGSAARSFGPTARRGRQATRAAKRTRQAIRNARREQRQRDARRRKAATRAISRATRWWWRKRHSKTALRLLRSLWNGAHWVSRKGTAAALSAWLRTAQIGHRLGRQARALHADAVLALRAPFTGLGADWARFRAAQQRRFEAEVRRAQGKTTAGPIGTGATYSREGTTPMIRTNVRELIDAIQAAPQLGRGESPHAAEVHQWHRDVAELADVLATYLSRDVEVAIETLPPEGAAHDITASVPDGFRASAEQVAEATGAWELAQGTKLDRLYSEDAREGAWDRSTMPEA